jgi:putative tryptophan/tyrosine transport system substrate-binding protein
MQRYFILLLFLAGCGLISGSAGAAERNRPVRIGALTDSWGPTPGIVGLRDGLKELGYRENIDFAIGVRFTQGDTSALPAAARDLVQQGADILFPGGRDELRAAKMATTKVPVVFVGGDDPVRLGLIQSFAKPGGNITGVSNLDLELGPKRLEIFRSIVPGMKRVLFPHNSALEINMAEAKTYRDTARKLGITLVAKPVESEEDAQRIVSKVHDYNVQGILAPHGVSLNIPGLIQDATLKQRIATMFRLGFFVENGGLASYSPDDYESGRRSARLVEKILKGANPGEIPVEVNTKIELVINVKVAKALGLEIPPEVLFRADRLIR